VLSQRTIASMIHKSGWWEPVWELVVHVLIGSLLFTLIFAPAVGLDLALKYLKNTVEVSEFLVSLLTGTKIAIAVIDTVLYVIFMLRMGWLFISKLWS
jgi:hypothetical protein